MIEEDAKTLWCGNLSEQVNEELLYELFLQAGPLEKVRIPRERDGRQRTFAFITFSHEVSVPYAISLLQGTSLFNRTLSLHCRNQSASLPPPIRCSSEQPIEFSALPNLRSQFVEMTDSYMQQQSFPPMNGEQHMHSNVVHMERWSQRQHPYRPEDRDRGQGGRHRGRQEGGGRSHHMGSRDMNHMMPRERRDRRDRHYGGRRKR